MIVPSSRSRGVGGETKRRAALSHARISRVLVYLDHDTPIKYPIYKNVMTIGRSEQAEFRSTATSSAACTRGSCRRRTA